MCTCTFLQRYQRKANVASIHLATVIVTLQVLAVGSYLLSARATFRLPSALRQPYQIYNALEDASVRPLLPFKVAPPLVTADSDALSEDEVSELLTCGVDVTQPAFVPPADIPRWALPTNNTGLNDLWRNQVRLLQPSAYRSSERI